MKQNKLYYMVDVSGQILEASYSAGYWEQEGIPNLEVIKHCLGLNENKLYLGASQVSFKCKEL